MNAEAAKAPTFWNALSNLPYAVQWIDAGGTKTRTLVAGDEAQPPLIFIHGTGGHLETYIHNIKAHSRHFRTYAFDLIGHGWSDRPEIDYEIDTYIDHLLRFMDALGLEKAHFSGQSLGGWILARLAARHPDRVDRLILNTAGGYTADRAVMQKARRLGRAASGAQMSREAVRERLEWLVHDPASVSEEMVDVRHAIYASPGYPAIMERVLCLQDPEIRQRNLLTEEELEAIKARTLVIWTDHDPTAATAIGREIARLVPDAKFELIEGCAHWPQLEKPDLFNTIQLQFLTAA